jgi:PAS domain S-box-containing protein
MNMMEAVGGANCVPTNRSQIERELEEQLASLEVALTTNLEAGHRKAGAGRVVARMLEAALDASGDPVWATDSKGRCFVWNQAATRAWGWRREEVLGRTLRGLRSPVDPVSVEASPDGESEDPRFVAAAPHVRVTRALRDKTGRRIATLGMARRVAGAEPAADPRMAELESAARASQEMLAVASHELASPVAALRLLIGNTLRAASHGRECPAWLGERVKMAEQQVDRLAHKLEVLLDVSRIRAGKLVLRPERFDLMGLAREVVARQQEPALSQGCELTLHGPETLEGTWDRVRMDQVLTNLLGNALKFGKGAPVEVSLARSDGFVRMEVRDRGRGISLADQRRIFQPFERGGPQDCAGLGLGLWIVREIVSAHQGAVTVSSVVSDGSRFTVVLPET